ncbi:hypothetical protein E2C01_009938 [Portunus trituberculatus]|uniref:Uncharacterized protein n=1 Tax=Portunus trituberculatus TaxID=210409 RepID=A0A5B7D719_PORTR|nr:hypothetical protein [Portunus trituberculatus]
MRARQTWASSDASTLLSLDSTSSPPEERGETEALRGRLTLRCFYTRQNWNSAAVGEEEAVAARTCLRLCDARVTYGLHGSSCEAVCKMAISAAVSGAVSEDAVMIRQNRVCTTDPPLPNADPNPAGFTRCLNQLLEQRNAVRKAGGGAADKEGCRCRPLGGCWVMGGIIGVSIL